MEEVQKIVERSSKEVADNIKEKSILFRTTKKEDLDELFKELRIVYEGFYDGVYQEIRYENFYAFLEHFVKLFRYERQFIDTHSTSL